MDLERLPIGNFDTNLLILKLGMRAYNIFRIIGIEAMKSLICLFVTAQLNDAGYAPSLKV